MMEKKETKSPKKKSTPVKKAEKKPITKKKVAPKKAATKKAAVKKTTAKKEAPKKSTKKPADTRIKKTKQEYIDVINWKKWEAHNMGWLYIEINADDLLTELEVGANNIATTCSAIMDCMLEGDAFIVEPKSKNKVSSSLTVRYYVDNLSPERRSYNEVL